MNDSVCNYCNCRVYIYVNQGGRNKWLDFVNAVPAAWTLFGVWITWSKMFAVLSAFFTFLITLAVTQLITIL